MLPIDTIDALGIGEATAKHLRKLGITTVAKLQQRWSAFAEGRIRRFGPARVAVLWKALSAYLAGQSAEPLPQDPTPEQIAARAAELRSGWGPRRYPQAEPVVLVPVVMGNVNAARRDAMHARERSRS